MIIIRKLIRSATLFLRDLYFVFKYSLGHVCPKKKNDEILIYIDGRMGDILMDANAIMRLVEYYKRDGKRIYMVGNEITKATLDLFMSLEDIVFIVVKTEDINAANLKPIEQFLKTKYFDKIIIITQWEHLYILNLIACANCNESWEVVSKLKGIRMDLLIFCLKRLHRDFTNRIIVDRETQQVERTKRLLTALGISDFKTSIVYIPKTCDYAVPGSYITVSVDSNDTKRRWQTEKFIQLVQLLLRHGDDDIYLTGMHVDKSEIEEYKSIFQNEHRVKIRIGQLQLKEWVELIRGSALQIGVDSGSIHIAACVGTKSICLTGVWDGRRIFPYQRDIKTDNTETPICVVRTDVKTESLPCYGCLGVKCIGYGNKQCLIECINQQPCLCLQAIEVEDVWNAVSNITHAIDNQ